MQLKANVQSGPQGREYDAVADRIAADRRGRILDWGAGHGQVTARLLARGLDVTSYDYLPDEPAGRKRLNYADAEMDHSPDPVVLPYETGSFDAVLSCGVLEHVADPDASLDEIHRVLAPGGRLYVYKLPNQHSYLEWIARRSGRLYYHGQLPDDRLYTKATARDILERHGYTVRELRTANILPLMVIGQRRRATDLVWGFNRMLARAPGLAHIATNVEAVADRIERPVADQPAPEAIVSHAD
jgi:SAM-dependent methyltransferase